MTAVKNAPAKQPGQDHRDCAPGALPVRRSNKNLDADVDAGAHALCAAPNLAIQTIMKMQSSCAQVRRT